MRTHFVFIRNGLNIKTTVFTTKSGSVENGFIAVRAFLFGPIFQSSCQHFGSTVPSHAERGNWVHYGDLR